jgi:hypothetical protein
MINEQVEAKEIYVQAVQKAWESSEFKNQLIANPIQTLEELLGSKVTIPSGKTLVVLEEADTRNRQPKSDETYLIIPENNYELTDVELETIAGGVTIDITFGCSEKEGWHFEIKISASIL